MSPSRSNTHGEAGSSDGWSRSSAVVPGARRSGDEARLRVATAGTLGYRVAESWATRPSPRTQMASHRLAVLAGVVETTDVEMRHD